MGEEKECGSRVHEYKGKPLKIRIRWRSTVRIRMCRQIASTGFVVTMKIFFLLKKRCMERVERVHKFSLNDIKFRKVCVLRERHHSDLHIFLFLNFLICHFCCMCSRFYYALSYFSQFSSFNLHRNLEAHSTYEFNLFVHRRWQLVLIDIALLFCIQTFK